MTDSLAAGGPSLFANQRILIISPQPWDHIHLSKHNYAIELAERGNEVLFLNPPDRRGGDEFAIHQAAEDGRIRVISYRSSVPVGLRFHARRVFDFFQRRQMARLLERTQAIDVVWCFDFNTFSDLRVFGARTNIYHPVDPVSDPSHVDVGRTADVILSVSKEILDSFASVRVPRFVIDHGLAPPFARHAANPSTGERKAGPVRVGYAGNLARPPLNRPVVTRMVTRNPEVEFHFWGPSKVLDYVPDEFRSEVQTFMNFLEAAPNVILHGPVSSERLAEEFQQMDCFVMSYRRHPTESDLSNSHKILEYFSTGKVVVSTPIARYADHGNLLVSGMSEDDSDLPDLLSQTLARLDEVNSESQMAARRELALDNTYARQVDRIRDIVLALPARQS